MRKKIKKVSDISATYKNRARIQICGRTVEVDSAEEIDLTTLVPGDKFIVKKNEFGEGPKTYTFLKSYNFITPGKPAWDRKIFSFDMHDEKGHLIGGATKDIYLNNKIEIQKDLFN